MRADAQRAGSARFSIQPQVLFAFPRMDGAAVAFVFGEFGVSKRVVQMVSECRTHDGIGVEFVDGLAEGARQRADAAFAAFVLVEVVRGACERRSGKRAARDTVGGSADQHGKREIGIARWI